MTDMWTCPSCGRSFASRNQSHTCAALGDLVGAMAALTGEPRR